MKTVTVTVKEALLLRKLLTAMNDTKMPLKTAEKIVQFTDELAAVYADYNANLASLYEQVAEKDANGQPIKDSDKNIVIADKHKVDFQRRKKAIEQGEVELNVMLELGDLINLDITPTEYRLLRRVLV